MLLLIENYKNIDVWKRFIGLGENDFVYFVHGQKKDCSFESIQDARDAIDENEKKFVKTMTRKIK